MTLQYFRKLAENKQYRCVLEKGAYVTERNQGDALVMLFQIDQFYIEIFFQIDTDELLGAYCFQNTDELQLYLEQINLDELLAIDPFL